MSFSLKQKYNIGDLVEIMALLRAPDGCPWDREQTHKSIRRNFIEETYEVAEAIDLEDTALLSEELGDVLMQVVFHTQIEKEKGTFDFDDVCDGVCRKMILRHPHVFSDTKVSNSDDVLRNWDAIKKREKSQETQTDVLKSVSAALPALMRAEKIQGKAAKSGFGSNDVIEALDCLRDKIDELETAVKNDRKIFAELGDVLYAVVNIARHGEIDPEESLGKACDRFIERFSDVEELAAQKNIELGQADKKR